MNNKDKFVVMSTKVSPEAAEVWDSICQARQTDTYHMLQNFIYTMIRAAADPHALNPDIQKLLAMLRMDVDWRKAINLAAHGNKGLKIAQMVLILKQEGKEDVAAVMINKAAVPGEESELRMTENVDDILERVTEVTMRGIYKRLRLLGAQMQCNNLSDVLLTLIEKQSTEEIDEQNRQEMTGAVLSEYGKEYAYGKRTKQTKRRTPDGEVNRQMKIFDSDRPYGEQADEYLANLEERAKAEQAGDLEQTEQEASRDLMGELSTGHALDDDLERKMGFRPFGQEW